jgi:hypothetical protein
MLNAVCFLRFRSHNSLDLVKNLTSKDPHYIRCLKPNDKKKKKEFDAELVRHQVRYLGLMENIRVRRAGYSFRMDFARFMQRFKMLAKATWPNFKAGAQNGCRIVCSALSAYFLLVHACIDFGGGAAQEDRICIWPQQSVYPQSKVSAGAGRQAPSTKYPAAD